MVQVKPLVLILEDVLAHTFNKVQHMATVHFENGQYHLHAQLNEVTKDDEKKSQQNAPSSLKVDETFSAHLLQEFNFALSNNQSATLIAFSQKQDVVSPFIKKSNPPPQA